MVCLYVSTLCQMFPQNSSVGKKRITQKRCDEFRCRAPSRHESSSSDVLRKTETWNTHRSGEITLNTHTHTAEIWQTTAYARWWAPEMAGSNHHTQSTRTEACRKWSWNKSESLHPSSPEPWRILQEIQTTAAGCIQTHFLKHTHTDLRFRVRVWPFGAAHMVVQDFLQCNEF